MCSDPDSRPPIEPTPGSAAEGRRIGLITDDGTRLGAWEARAPKPTGAGIIVLPDYYGLTGFYEELALRFADAGVDALAIDYYGRTADPPPRSGPFDHQAHARRTKWAELQADVSAAAAHLRLQRNVRALFSVGFCFGGRVSFLLASLPKLSMAGVIGFYGWPVGPFINDTPAPADLAPSLTAPVLAIFGGSDAKIGSADVERFREALGRANVTHDVLTYPGAPHSFFDRAQKDHASAAADAWDRVRGFIGAQAGARSG